MSASIVGSLKAVLSAQSAAYEKAMTRVAAL